MLNHAGFSGVMSEPIKFEQANCVFKAPANMEDCGDLHCFHDKEQPITVSCWQLDPGEIEELKKNGGKLYMMTHAAIFVPTSLTSHLPFVKTEQPGNEKEPVCCTICQGRGHVGQYQQEECSNCNGDGFL